VHLRPDLGYNLRVQEVSNIVADITFETPAAQVQVTHSDQYNTDVDVTFILEYSGAEHHRYGVDLGYGAYAAVYVHRDGTFEWEGGDELSSPAGDAGDWTDAVHEALAHALHP